MATSDDQLKVIEENHRSHLLTTLNNMRENQTLCDVKIRCGTTELPAHRCVLSAASPYFQILFKSFEDESIIVPVDASTMMIFLDYMYTGKIILNANTLGSALIAAHLLQLPQIYAYCMLQIIGVIDDQNFTRLWKAAEKCSDKNLQAIITDYSCDNLKNLLANKSIKKCSTNQIKAIISTKKLSPEETMQVVMVWLQEDLANRKPYLQTLWTDIALPQQIVTAMFQQEPFLQYPDVSALIKTAVEMQNEPGRPLSIKPKLPEIPPNSPEANLQLSETPPILDKTPPLPPRRPKNVEPPTVQRTSIFIPPTVQRSSIFIPPIVTPQGGLQTSPTSYTPQIDSTVPLFSLKTEPEVSAIEEINSSQGGPRTPIPPPRSMSLPMEAMGEPHLLIFAVTATKRLAVQKYNLQTKVWSPSHDFPLPKQYVIPPIITALQDKIYILGGGTTATDFDSSVYVTSTSDYIRTERCNMLLPRVHFGVVTLNGLLYVIGGRNKTGWLRDVERFNPLLNVWHQMAPLSQPKSALGVTVVQGRIYVIGGLGGHKLFSNTTECYDPLADQWTQLVPLSFGRYRAGIATLDKKIYVLGGAIEPTQQSCDLKSFLTYDTIQHSWQQIESPETFTDDQPCMVTWNNQLWIISRRSYSLCSFDPTTNTWSRLEPSSATSHWQYIKNIVLVNI